MLPSWLDTEKLRTITVVATGSFGALALTAMVLIKKALTKIVFVVVLAALALGSWIYRSDIQECAKTCSCAIADYKIKVPNCTTTPAATTPGAPVAPGPAIVTTAPPA